MSMFTTCLWFDGKAQEAAEFYVSVFPNSSLDGLEYYPEGSRGEAGSVLTASFTLDGQKFIGLNGGPHFTFSEAVSLQIPCTTQGEIDHYWDLLTADGGEESMCGRLKDKFGFSWQVVTAGPIFDGTPEENARMNEALMSMRKLDLEALAAAKRGD